LTREDGRDARPPSSYFLVAAIQEILSRKIACVGK
jgi:hypothetical protein